MYKKFFGLETNPFGAGPDPRYLFMAPHTQEALACLEYGIYGRKGFTVLTGEVGTGKTTLLRRALGALRQQQVSTAFVFNPRLDVLDFFEFVLTDFGLVPASRTKSGMLLQLNNWLLERFAAKEICVVIVDEAQTLSWEVLEEIRLLTNLETSSEKLLQIVLSGQPELEEKLRDPSVRQLRQRVQLWCRTEPLTAEQVKGYVAERLRIAGASSPIFTPGSLELVHRYTGGIPRLINLVCEHSLLAAYVDQRTTISAEMVETVAGEVDLAPPAEEPAPNCAEASAGHARFADSSARSESARAPAGVFGDRPVFPEYRFPEGGAARALEVDESAEATPLRFFSSLRNRLRPGGRSRTTGGDSDEAPRKAGAVEVAGRRKP